MDAAGSVRHYVQALRGDDSRRWRRRGFTGGAADLRRAQLAEYWMGTTAAREACTRRMLLGFAAAGGALDARVRELAEGRAYNPQPFRRPLPPYPEVEWARLTRGLPGRGDDGLPGAQGRPGRSGARAGSRAQGGCDLDNLRWLLARNGPVAACERRGARGGLRPSTVRGGRACCKPQPGCSRTWT